MLERRRQSYFLRRPRTVLPARRAASDSTSRRRNNLLPPTVFNVANWPELLRPRTVSAETPSTRAASEGVMSSLGSRLVMAAGGRRCAFVHLVPSYQTRGKPPLSIDRAQP